MGAHVLAIKDMARSVPAAGGRHSSVKALKEEVGLPVHFHTHDTSGIAAASVLAAVEAGVDAVDGADRCHVGPDVAAQSRAPSSKRCVSGRAIRGSIPTNCGCISAYWEQVRRGYVAFESDIRAGASEVYVHGMPGGQYTNLREQARSLGLDDHRWPEVAQAYAEVNDMFGDIVKVTPTSKVVGDMALTMVTSGLTPEAVLDPDVESHFPSPSCALFRGDLGQPTGGFPADLQNKSAGADEAPDTRGPGELLPPADLGGGAPRPRSQAGQGDHRRRTRVLSHVSEGVHRVRRRPRKVRRCQRVADAGVFLRHGARGRRSTSTSSAARR